MGAFRARSLDFLGVAGFAVDKVSAWLDVPAAVEDDTVGLLFCASPSVSATAAPLSCLCFHGVDGGQVCCCCCWFPDMLVSGIPSFLGGISGSRVDVLAVSVISGRFDDCRAGRKEEKGHLCARRQCAHRLVAGGWEANRNIVANEGPVVRRVAMWKRIDPEQWQRVDVGWREDVSRDSVWFGSVRACGRHL